MKSLTKKIAPWVRVLFLKKKKPSIKYYHSDNLKNRDIKMLEIINGRNKNSCTDTKYTFNGKATLGVSVHLLYKGRNAQNWILNILEINLLIIYNIRI